MVRCVSYSSLEAVDWSLRKFGSETLTFTLLATFNLVLKVSTFKALYYVCYTCVCTYVYLLSLLVVEYLACVF